MSTAITSASASANLAQRQQPIRAGGEKAGTATPAAAAQHVGKAHPSHRGTGAAAQTQTVQAARQPMPAAGHIDTLA